jgi:hypothetical protein
MSTEYLPTLVVWTNGQGALMRAECLACEEEVTLIPGCGLLTAVNEHLSVHHQDYLNLTLSDGRLVTFRTEGAPLLTSEQLQIDRARDGRSAF